MHGIKIKKTNEVGTFTTDMKRPPAKKLLKRVSGPGAQNASYIDPYFFGGSPFSNQPDFSRETGRRGVETRGLSTGPASTNLINSAAARRRSRYAVLAEPYAKRAVDILVSNVVGSGHQLISEAPDPEFKRRVEKLWRQWSGVADTTGALPFTGLESLAYRSAIEGGDCFVRMRVRRPVDGLPVPLQLQLIEAEQVPYYKNETVGPNGGNQIIGGIQFDAFGKPAFYHMFAAHPGEFYDLQSVDAATVKVPAEDVLHIHEVKRPNDVRGMPALSQVLIKLSDFERYMDSELMRKKAASLIGGFIREPYDQSYANPFLTGASGDNDEIEIEAYEAGEWVVLPPGFEVTFNAPPDVGPNFGSFLTAQLRMVAASMNITMEQLTGNLEGVSDRTLRAALLEFKRIVAATQKNIIVHQFLNPVFSRWFDLAVLSGALTLPAGADENDFKKVRWVAEPWKHLHPQQDIAAEKMEIRAGLKTRTEALIERGKDPVEFDETVATERERENDLGVVYDTDASNLSVSGVAHSFDPIERDINVAIGQEDEFNEESEGGDENE
jgi:lambda family phage portal protein